MGDFKEYKLPYYTILTSVGGTTLFDSGRAPFASNGGVEFCIEGRKEVGSKIVYPRGLDLLVGGGCAKYIAGVLPVSVQLNDNPITIDSSLHQVRIEPHIGYTASTRNQHLSTSILVGPALDIYNGRLATSSSAPMKIDAGLVTRVVIAPQVSLKLALGLGLFTPKANNWEISLKATYAPILPGTSFTFNDSNYPSTPGLQLDPTGFRPGDDLSRFFLTLALGRRSKSTDKPIYVPVSNLTEVTHQEKIEKEEDRDTLRNRASTVYQEMLDYKNKVERIKNDSCQEGNVELLTNIQFELEKYQHYLEVTIPSYKERRSSFSLLSDERKDLQRMVNFLEQAQKELKALIPQVKELIEEQKAKCKTSDSSQGEQEGSGTNGTQAGANVGEETSQGTPAGSGSTNQGGGASGTNGEATGTSAGGTNGGQAGSKGTPAGSRSAQGATNGSKSGEKRQGKGQKNKKQTVAKATPAQQAVPAPASTSQTPAPQDRCKLNRLTADEMRDLRLFHPEEADFLSSLELMDPNRALDWIDQKKAFKTGTHSSAYSGWMIRKVLPGIWNAAAPILARMLAENRKRMEAVAVRVGGQPKDIMAELMKNVYYLSEPGRYRRPAALENIQIPDDPLERKVIYMQLLHKFGVVDQDIPAFFALTYEQHASNVSIIPQGREFVEKVVGQIVRNYQATVKAEDHYNHTYESLIKKGSDGEVINFDELYNDPLVRYLPADTYEKPMKFTDDCSFALPRLAAQLKKENGRAGNWQWDQTTLYSPLDMALAKLLEIQITNRAPEYLAPALKAAGGVVAPLLGGPIGVGLALVDLAVGTKDVFDAADAVERARAMSGAGANANVKAEEARLTAAIAGWIAMTGGMMMPGLPRAVVGNPDTWARAALVHAVRSGRNAMVSSFGSSGVSLGWTPPPGHENDLDAYIVVWEANAAIITKQVLLATALAAASGAASGALSRQKQAAANSFGESPKFDQKISIAGLKPGERMTVGKKFPFTVSETVNGQIKSHTYLGEVTDILMVEQNGQRQPLVLIKGSNGEVYAATPGGATYLPASASGNASAGQVPAQSAPTPSPQGVPSGSPNPGTTVPAVPTGTIAPVGAKPVGYGPGYVPGRAEPGEVTNVKVTGRRPGRVGILGNKLPKGSKAPGIRADDDDHTITIKKEPGPTKPAASSSAAPDLTPPDRAKTTEAIYKVFRGEPVTTRDADQLQSQTIYDVRRMLHNFQVDSHKLDPYAKGKPPALAEALSPGNLADFCTTARDWATQYLREMGIPSKDIIHLNTSAFGGKLNRDQYHDFMLWRRPDGKLMLLDPTFGQFLASTPHPSKPTAIEVGQRLREIAPHIADEISKYGAKEFTPEVADAYRKSFNPTGHSYYPEYYVKKWGKTPDHTSHDPNDPHYIPPPRPASAGTPVPEFPQSSRTPSAAELKSFREKAAASPAPTAQAVPTTIHDEATQKVVPKSGEQKPSTPPASQPAKPPVATENLPSPKGRPELYNSINPKQNRINGVEFESIPDSYGPIKKLHQNIRADGRTAGLMSGQYDSSKKESQMGSIMLFDDAPKTVVDATGKKTPLILYGSLRAMKDLGIPYGGLKRHTASYVTNQEASLEIAQALKAGKTLQQAVEGTRCTALNKSILAASGHRVTAVRVVAHEGPVSVRSIFTAADSPTKVQQEMQKYGLKLTDSTFDGFDIVFDLEKAD